MNEINALIWPNATGIGDHGRRPPSTRTADIAKQFGVIKKAPTQAPTAPTSPRRRSRS